MSCHYWLQKKDRTCALRGKEEYTIDDKQYCKRHYTLLSNSNDSSTHSNESSTHSNESSKSLPKQKKEKIICSFILSSKKQCSFTSTSIFDNKHYCTRHFKKVDPLYTPPCSFNTCQQTREMKTSLYCQEHELQYKEKKEIDDLIQSINHMSILKDRDIPSIRKQYHKILLKIHPDKCKNDMIDSHACTIKVNRIMDKLK